MTAFFAAQLIYTNVEAEFSPRGLSGFQTLFYTQEGLSHNEMVEIEARLFYNLTNGDAGLKRVFFTNELGKIILAEVVPLSDTDRFQRTGLSFAHALVFTPETFAQLNNNPFPIFGCFPFLRTVSAARKVGNLQTGNIAHAELVVPKESPREDLAWTRDTQSLGALLLFATQARELLAERRAVSFLGSREAMFDTLAIVFALIPVPLRISCSFDTHFLGGTLSRLPYWAVGLPTEYPRQHNFLPFDLARRQFATYVSSTPRTAFECWVVNACKAGNLGKYAPVITPMYWLGEGLEGRPSEKEILAQIPAALKREFVERSGFTWEHRIREHLQEQVGPVLGLRALAQARQWMQEQDLEAISILKHGFDASLLVKWVFDLYWNNPLNKPTQEELDDLKALVKRYPNTRYLRLVYLRWAKHWSQLARALAVENKASVQEYAKWALNTVRVRVEWSAEWAENTMFLGPILIVEEENSEEGYRLLSVLLDICEKPERFNFPSPLPTNIKDWRVRLPWNKPKSSIVSPSGMLRDAPRTRCMWLIEMLSHSQQ